MIGSIGCYASDEDWFYALTYRENYGKYPSEGSDAAVMLLPGDRVQILQSKNVDERPGLVNVTGSLYQVKTLSGIKPGTSCWLFTGSNSYGPLFE